MAVDTAAGTMRYMIIVRANAHSEAGAPPAPELAQAMARYHQQLAAAGVLLDANGLRPSRDGWRLHWQQGRRQLTDGPFAETHELIAGYTLIQVRSRAEALEWSRRFPAPFGAGVDCAIEVRQLYELDDFPPGPSQDRQRPAQVSSAPPA